MTVIFSQHYLVFNLFLCVGAHIMVSLQQSEDSLLRLNPNLSSKVCFSLKSVLIGDFSDWENGPSSSGFCLFYSSWCWCEIPNSLQPAAFLSSHREGLVSLLTFSFSTLKLLAITIIQRSLPAPGILQNLLSTVGLHPISLEDILEKGCRGETFPDVFIQKNPLSTIMLG